MSSSQDHANELIGRLKVARDIVAEKYKGPLVDVAAARISNDIRALSGSTTSPKPLARLMQKYGDVTPEEIAAFQMNPFYGKAAVLQKKILEAADSFKAYAEIFPDPIYKNEWKYEYDKMLADAKAVMTMNDDELTVPEIDYEGEVKDIADRALDRAMNAQRLEKERTSPESLLSRTAKRLSQGLATAGAFIKRAFSSGSSAPPTPNQKSFVVPELDEFWNNMQNLSNRVQLEQRRATGESKTILSDVKKALDSMIKDRSLATASRDLKSSLTHLKGEPSYTELAKEIEGLATIPSVNLSLQRLSEAKPPAQAVDPKMEADLKEALENIDAMTAQGLDPRAVKQAEAAVKPVVAKQADGKKPSVEGRIVSEFRQLVKACTDAGLDVQAKELSEIADTIETSHLTSVEIKQELGKFLKSEGETMQLVGLEDASFRASLTKGLGNLKGLVENQSQVDKTRDARANMTALRDATNSPVSKHPTFGPRGK